MICGQLDAALLIAEWTFNYEICGAWEKSQKENSWGKTRPEFCLYCVWHLRVEERVWNTHHDFMTPGYTAWTRQSSESL